MSVVNCTCSASYLAHDSALASESALWLQALSTKRGTSTPMWLGLWVMLKYRTKNNYCSGLYLFGRLFDKAVFTFLTATFYLWVGKNNTAANVPNLGGLLFLW